MREVPILFSGPMVRALLEDRKTQTRRIVKPQPSAGVRRSAFVASGLEDGHGREIKQRIFVGDALWVKETHSVIALFAHHRDGLTDSSYRIEYRAGGERHLDYSGPFGGDERFAQAYDRQRGKWRPSIFMPRWASRITLKVTQVRVQRLQDISEVDAIAEGLERVSVTFGVSGLASSWSADPRASYRALWESINGHRSWDENPWVWVYTFAIAKAEGR